MQEVNCLKSVKVFINLPNNKLLTLNASIIIKPNKAYILTPDTKFILKYEQELSSFVLQWGSDYYKVKSHNIPIPISL